MPESPFPKKLDDGRVVVGEICHCDHSIHAHTNSLLAYGHGKCVINGCPCSKFTSKERVYAD